MVGGKKLPDKTFAKFPLFIRAFVAPADIEYSSHSWSRICLPDPPPPPRHPCEFRPTVSLFQIHFQRLQEADEVSRTAHPKMAQSQPFPHLRGQRSEKKKGQVWESDLEFTHLLAI